MKHIKKINELMSFLKEQEELQQKAKYLPQVYKKRIEDCLLYISDDFKIQSYDSEINAGRFTFYIQRISFNEIDLLMSDLKSSNEKLVFELNAEVRLRVLKYKDANIVGDFRCQLDNWDDLEQRIKEGDEFDSVMFVLTIK